LTVGQENGLLCLQINRQILSFLMEWDCDIMDITCLEMLMNERPSRVAETKFLFQMR